MKRRNLKRQWPLLLTSAVLFALPLSTTAEDIDIFSGSSGGSGANVLVIVDNTTNWSDKKQKWPGNEVQGQAELEALIAVVPTLNDNVNVGLMLFNENGLTNCCSGGYIRHAYLPTLRRRPTRKHRCGGPAQHSSDRPVALRQLQ